MAQYDRKSVEEKWQKKWAEEKLYEFDAASGKPVFSIDTPPPTISGKLHVGHVFSYTQAEIIARFKRMTGYEVFYPMGFDDNGIPTEILVEKELGIDIKNTPRGEFVEKCLEVTKSQIEIFKNLWKWLGFSVDWRLQYDTISSEVQALSQQRFVELVRDGIVVKKEFPALWCVRNQTTIAQAETEEKEVESFFVFLDFVAKSGEKIQIATTRPEILPAVAAIFVHPEDERFASMIGETVVSPLGKKVFVMAEETVKPEKWTGAVMACSYGDSMDLFWFQKHKLSEQIVISQFGKMQNTGLDWLDGLSVHSGREAMIAWLEEKNLVVKKEKITHGKMYSERGKCPVEILPVSQRFLKILENKTEILETALAMDWRPDHMKKRFLHWLEDLQWDRNISRSRKFGIPLPVRYKKSDGSLVLPEKIEAPVDPVFGEFPGSETEDLVGEELVLDTRFTSGLTRKINQKTAEKFGFSGEWLPMSLRPQAHDIIRTRLLYSVVHARYEKKKKPFETVMISGHVLAGKGEKMSKSKGNAKFTPEELLENFSADAIRYFAASGELGADMVFDEQILKIGQKLLTKLWNVANFVGMQTEDFAFSSEEIPETLQVADRWILARAAETAELAKKYFEYFEVGHAKLKIEEFFWADFCDVYLELVKMRVYQPENFADGAEKRVAAQWTMMNVFRQILKLFAPILPFLTEELWERFFVSDVSKSVHREDFCENFAGISPDGLAGFEKVLEVVEAVRKFKSQQQISLGAAVSRVVVKSPAENLEILRAAADDLRGVAKAVSIEFVEASDFSVDVEK